MPANDVFRYTFSGKNVADDAPPKCEPTLSIKSRTTYTKIHRYERRASVYKARAASPKLKSMHRKVERKHEFMPQEKVGVFLRCSLLYLWQRADRTRDVHIVPCPLSIGSGQMLS